MSNSKQNALAIRITNQTTRAYLRRLVTTGVYGNKETTVAENLIYHQINYLLESGKLAQREQDGKHAKEIDKSITPEEDENEETGTD